MEIQEGLSRNVLEDRKAIIVNEESGPQFLVVPILSGDRALGVINLVRYGLVPFTELDLEWMTTVANHIGFTLERTKLLERYEQLVESEKVIVQQLPLGKVLNEIVEHAAQTLDAPMVDLMLVEEDGSLPIKAASSGLPRQTGKPR